MSRAVKILLLLLYLSLLNAREVQVSLNPAKGVGLLQPFTVKITPHLEVGDTLKAVVADSSSTFRVTNLRDEVPGKSAVLTLVPLRTGELYLPAYTMVIGTPAGRENVLLPPTKVTVNATLKPADVPAVEGDSLDPVLVPLGHTAPLMPRKTGWLAWLPLVLLIAVVWLLWRWLKKRGKKLPLNVFKPAEKTDTRPWWQQATDRIIALEQQNMPAKGQFLAYYTELDTILRWFWEKQYGFNALELTTLEIQEAGRIPAAEWQKVKPFFNRSDLVKFAQAMPEIALANGDSRLLKGYLAAFNVPGEQKKNA